MTKQLIQLRLAIKTLTVSNWICQETVWLISTLEVLKLTIPQLTKTIKQMFSDMPASTLDSLLNKSDNNRQIDVRRHVQPRSSMDVTKPIIKHPLSKILWSMIFHKLLQRKLNAKTMEKIYARSTSNSEQTPKANKSRKKLVEILTPSFPQRVWAHPNPASKFIIKELPVGHKEPLASKVATNGATECTKSQLRKMVRQLHLSLRTLNRKEWLTGTWIKD